MGYRILVVEDEKEIASAIEIYLKTQNYEVVRANNGEEALAVSIKSLAKANSLTNPFSLMYSAALGKTFKNSSSERSR